MASNTNLNLVHPAASVARQRVAVNHGALAFWHTIPLPAFERRNQFRVREKAN
jgi:hypothetical protein